MSHKRYLILLLFSVSVLLFAVSAINYLIDPASIYHEVDQHDANTTSAEQFVHRLIRTKNGLLFPNNSWNERDIKRLLAETNVAAECAVIGSSRVLQISSFGENMSLTTLCPSLVNLGVPGGSLEDYLALSFVLLNKSVKPKVVVFGVDPWVLDFHRDSRWVRYKEYYSSMKELLRTRSSIYEQEHLVWKKYATNLINPYYLVRSIQKVFSNGLVIKSAPEFDEMVGFELPVLRPDGSLVYSKDNIAQDKSKQIPIGGSDYKIRDPQYTEKAVKLFSDLIRYIEKSGVAVVVVLTPYHHNVWADKESSTTKALLAVESRVIELGRKLGVEVLGSYSPYKVGCNNDEFFDFMHPARSCVSKINN